MLKQITGILTAVLAVGMIAVFGFVQFNTPEAGATETEVLEDSYTTGLDSTQTVRANFNKRFGQIFKASQGGKVEIAKFSLLKSGSPTGNAYVKIYEITGTPNSDAVPTGSALATSDAFDVSTLTGSGALKTFNFSGANQYQLTQNTWYAVEFYADDTSSDGTNYIGLGVDASSPTHQGNAFRYSTSYRYTVPATTDCIFYVYSLFTTSDGQQITTVESSPGKGWGAGVSAGGVLNW